MSYPEVVLRKNTERLLRRGHPWVYSGAVAQCAADLPPGSIVDVLDSRGVFVGRGYYNAQSNIAVRMLTRDRHEDIDVAFVTRAPPRPIG